MGEVKQIEPKEAAGSLKDNPKLLDKLIKELP